MTQVVGSPTAATLVDSGLLARVGGDRALLAEVIELFLEDGPMMVEQIRKGLADGDTAAVRMAAHSLAGTAANFDADELTTLARALETHARADDIAESRKAFARLVSAVRQVLDRLTVIHTALQCAS